jgi:ABC-type transport system involved in cytochrome c biogenesis permease component
VYETEAAGSATLLIKRRTWIQDAVRVYKVIVDDQVIGSIAAMQTKQFTLLPGAHHLRLAISATGCASSATIELYVKVGDQCTVQTARRGGLLSFLKLPLALSGGARALAESRELQSRYYEGPWIDVKVEGGEPE